MTDCQREALRLAKKALRVLEHVERADPNDRTAVELTLLEIEAGARRLRELKGKTP